MRGFRERETVARALERIREAVGLLEPERVSILEAGGRVAAEDVRSSLPVPHFARSAMDGYAVAAASTASARAEAPVTLRVVSDALPGRSTGRPLSIGEAARIATGAPIPEGADAVVRVERTREAAAPDAIEITAPVSAGKDVGAIGEDIRAGDLVVARGRVLRPQDLGVLSSIGVGTVAVVREPSVSVVITGDEILEPGQRPEGVDIGDANGPMLMALARRDGAGSVTRLRARDRRGEIATTLLDAAASDVVLVSGGSSVGPEDHAPRVVAELGELLVHGLAMRPSGPAGFGRVPREGRDTPAWVFLLPGNPVSALAAYEVLAGPTLRALGGRSMAWPHPRVVVPLGQKIESARGRVDYVRVTLEAGRAIPLATTGASILSSTTRADGVVLVEADRERLDPGEEVVIFLYDGR